MTQKIVYITGIAGFMGANLEKALRNAGHIVAGVDNLVIGRDWHIPTLREGKDWLNLDITKPGAVKIMANHMKSLKAVHPSAELTVVHFAWPAYDAMSFLFATHIVGGGTVGTAAIIQAGKLAGMNHFLFASSMAVYEGVSLTEHYRKIGYTEDQPLNPRGPYGVSKVAGELMTKEMCREAGIPFTIIRPHNVVGSFQAYWDPFRNVWGIFANAIAHGKVHLLHRGGEQQRVFTDIDDIMPILVDLVENGKRFGSRTFNVGPGPQQHVSIQELSQLIYHVACDITGKKLPYKPLVLEDKRIVTPEHAYCSDELQRTEWFASPSADLEKLAFNMVNAVLDRPIDFDYSMLRLADVPVPEQQTRLSIE